MNIRRVTTGLGTIAAITIFAVVAFAAPPRCPAGSVCFWDEPGFSGDYWEWHRAAGYRNMPPEFHDNVGSFVSATRACFINWSPRESVNVFAGDWRSDYDESGYFGDRIDGVRPGPCK
jgi:hypothetical protein